MSEWDPWSDCDTECGSGMMTRKRQVLKEPVNGGKHCSSMVQKRACMGTRCPNYPGSALKGIGIVYVILTVHDIQCWGEKKDYN